MWERSITEIQIISCKLDRSTVPWPGAGGCWADVHPALDMPSHTFVSNDVMPSGNFAESLSRDGTIGHRLHLTGKDASLGSYCVPSLDKQGLDAVGH